MTAGSFQAARAPEPPVATAPALWRALVERYGDIEMVRKDCQSVSFAEADRRSAGLARGLLAEGVGKGTRIGLQMGNSAEWLIAWLAINRIGGLAVLISTFFAGRELGYALRHADVAILLTADHYLRHDYIARLEEALPGLAESDGAEPLALTSAPYLRSIWLTRDAGRGWARGTLDDLTARGAASRRFDEQLLSAVEASVAPADPAILMYTSGSTSDPKGVVHTQGVTVRKTLFMTRGGGIIPSDTERGDRSIVTGPMFWVGGFLSAVGAMTAGATVICVDDHSPEALLRTIRDERATHLTGSEALLLSLRDSSFAQPGDFDRLKMQNTNQLPFFRPDTPRKRLPFALGMTETFGPHSGYNEGGLLLPPGAEGSVGPALAGVEYRIVDPKTGEALPFGEPGELCVRTPWLMDGMYKKERAEVFDADGYYHTGDRCVLRADGFLFFDSRLGGMIKTSGANVSPDEVEAVIRTDGEVIEVAVLGVPDRKAGQLVVAAVVKSAGSGLDEARLQARLRTQLSSFKVPKRVFFFDYDELPRTPSNKIRKPALLEVIRARLSSEAYVPSGRREKDA